MPFGKNSYYPLRVHISTILLALVLISSGTIFFLYYKKSIEMVDAQTGQLLSRLVLDTTKEIETMGDAPTVAVNLVGQHAVVRAKSLEERMQSILFLRQTVLSSKGMTSVYIGYGNGDFFLFRRIHGEQDRKALSAPEKTAWIVQSNEPARIKGMQEVLYLDASMQEVIREARPSSYDPRKRVWYTKAQQTDDLIRTDPYIFFTSGKTGITFARRFARGTAVVGADIRMETFDALLEDYRMTPGSHIVLFDQKEQIVAATGHESVVTESDGSGGETRRRMVQDTGLPVFDLLLQRWKENEFADTGRLFLKEEGIKWMASVIPLSGNYGDKLFLGIAVPYDELLSEVNAVRNQATLAVLFILLCLIPIAIITANRVSQPILRLAEEAKAVIRFDFRDTKKIKSSIKEVDELADSISFLKKTISEFLELIEAINREKNFDTMLERIGRESRLSAAADGVCIFFINREKETLEPEMYCDERHYLHDVPVAPLSLTGKNSLAASARIGKMCKWGISRGSQPELEELVAGGSSALTVWCLPLKDRLENVIGVTALFFRDSGKKIMFLEERLAFVQKISGLAGITLETRGLIQKQKELFDAFIKLMAGAIDAKSPYTGGHCQRVPVLVKMLAEAACDADEGTFRDFSLNEEQWEALHVASWLHDCGKVTTPEYVVDKATKLETIYDRIHEVRMRFEVMKCEAEIASLRALLAGGDRMAEQQKLARKRAELDDDFAFIAHCNLGGEVLSDDAVARLQEIGRKTWTRTLSDRIGISWEEERRKALSGEEHLPVVEPLLADRIEHLITRQPRNGQEEPVWDFQLQKPEYLFNRGELYNLSIAKGTLTDEERYIVNDHIVQTIRMLSELPYPEHLRNVPEIAGGHHETACGTGYPYGLTAEEMSVPAKMIVIADVFEALTASDRPYRRAKKLGEALRIMSAMQRGGHFDQDLYELFLKSGVFRRYGEEYLSAEQFEEVDIQEYLFSAAGRMQ